jgi:hypothetical protein
VKQKIFTGNSIDGASSKDGKPYSSLPNAFRYRKELVAGCTCNGKDVIGLASVKIEDDKTLRRGDLFANKGGLRSRQSRRKRTTEFLGSRKYHSKSVCKASDDRFAMTASTARARKCDP